MAKPVNASMLFNVVMGVFGHRRGPAGPTHRGPRGLDLQALRPVQGARLLLAEDNPINQQVAAEILQQGGFIVDVAADGAQALAMLETQAYDAVLMDIQMPTMDGYTATTRIREQPRWKDLPVLAMTANVMAEDRARAAQVGMNDHIAKPIVAQDLFAKLLTWVKHGHRPLPAGFGHERPPDAQETLELPALLPGIDLPKALLSVAGNRALLGKLLAEFAQAHGEDVQKLEAALAAGDLSGAQRQAHTLKGVGGAIAATGVQHRAAALEAALRARQHEGLELLLSDLRQAFEPVRDGLQAWMAQVQQRQLTTGDATEPGPTPEMVQSLIQRLRQRLQAMDFEAADLAQHLAQQLARHGKPPVAAIAAKLHQQAQDLEFELALTTLEQLQEGLA